MTIKKYIELINIKNENEDLKEIFEMLLSRIEILESRIEDLESVVQP